MQIFNSWDEAKVSEIKGGAITVGNFDGVHMGHEQVLAETNGHASAADGPTIVVTFEPHPRAVLYPEEAPRRLCHVQERMQYLQAAGVDAVLLLEFTKELATWSAERFSNTLHETFAFKHIHVGYDFAFGHDRQGHVDDLRRLGDTQHFTVTEASAFEMMGAVVSSSRIRSAVEAADFKLAKTLLGRDYSIAGKVLHGEKRGREMNFPTANVDVADLAHPPVGIYAVRANNIDRSKTWNGAAYLGYRPTFNGRTLLLETHLLDDSPDLYDHCLNVSFIKRIREDRKFTGHADLAAQIAKDCDMARQILEDTE
ncbi:bifunctional riboflavin kinase/FAD synthetase [Mariprofundus sp. KV]|uniref:bifunctional riboflavin kinase/FAD synthetase n=1 Tax=Mariprofundus sp. KV TaxID=2608715 RepID=UPI0015A29D4F|nr:bifunctional riboflavin kinase/FAD synthetase [Mariprofundus sp. KV]NWF36278.1 bifunctional riboflavin kinase/FAD synthetase [Mariprofundus sp. KV]